MHWAISTFYYTTPREVGQKIEIEIGCSMLHAPSDESFYILYMPHYHYVIFAKKSKKQIRPSGPAYAYGLCVTHAQHTKEYSDGGQHAYAYARATHPHCQRINLAFLPPHTHRQYLQLSKPTTPRRH